MNLPVWVKSGALIVLGVLGILVSVGWVSPEAVAGIISALSALTGVTWMVAAKSKDEGRGVKDDGPETYRIN